jgi:hypothetical protein
VCSMEKIRGESIRSLKNTPRGLPARRLHH